MMPCRLRSLLLAVIVLSNCITWTASRHHFTHNVSGHRSRHRRQGAGLFLSASYVVPGGEGSGWGDWGEISACSRTCGGGVASQKRICLQFGSDGQPQCTGGDTKYFSCETQDCPEGSQDFRAIQCTFYNNESFRGIKYKWEPYTKAPNPCELNCMPHGERFYYRHKSKVVDGTRCNDDSFDVCVNGTCQPVGCDMMLGSNAREDKCRQCRGNGANCHTFNGLLDTQELWKGYNDMMLIPEGSTNIYVAEVRPSNNYLALRANNGTYYLNGDYHIDFPRSMVIAGALWYYERSQQGFAAPDKLRCSGPTNEPLYLSLLLQDDNVGIEYEYSLPSEKAPRPTKKYNWVHENFTPCTVSCGGGLQTRNVTCRSSEELDIVDDGLCDEGLKPPLNQTCNTQACPAQWVEGPWSQCSKRCGKGGTRSREIRCEKIITSGFPSIVSDKECFDALGPKPELYQECNVNASCPTWFTGPWKPCDKLCGEGKRTRQVVCYQKNAGRIDVLDDEECAEEKPPADQPCTLQLCDGVDWVLTDWTGCDSCLSTIRTRVAVCATKGRTVVNASFCAYHPTPVLQEPCDVVPPCQVQWYATQWSKCSVECGKGVQTRQVFCGRFENDAVVIVNDSLCAGLPKYNTTKPCEVPKDKCPSKWYAGPWTECTKKCGGGVQYRQVMCLRGNKPANDCSVDLVLDSTNNCNEGSCNKDEIIPLDPKATPIMDEELEDCIDEEDYPEVGIDLDISDLKTTVDDRMFSDGTFSEDGSGMEFSVSTDFESIPTFEDTGSGFGLTSSTDDELFVEGLTKHINSLSSTDMAETTDVSASNTPSTVSEDVTDDYNTTDTDYDDTESTITEDTIVPKKVDTLSSKRLTSSGDDTEETVVSLSTDESTITEDTSETDETSSTDSSWSTQTDETSEFTTETASAVTESGTTKVKDLKKKKTKSITKSDSGETKKTTVSPPTDESTVTDFTKDTSETESTDSSEISENYSTESSLSTQTDETTETGDTELTSEPESSVSESDTTEVTDLKKKKTTVSSKSITKIDSDETKKTTVSPPTDESTVTGFTKDTSETESTESSETSETYSTESSLSTQTDETTESGDTELTSETDTSVSEPATTEVTALISGDTKKTTVPSPTTSETESTVSSETSESYSTESSLSTQTDETTESGDTELTTETESDATETTTLRVTESSITTEPIETKTPADFKTSEMSSSETSMTSETFKSESTESTATSETFKAESTTTEGLTETESELTEGSSEASSTLSSSDIVTLSTETKSSSTESSTEKPTEVSTESTEPSSTPRVSTVAGTETTEFTTSRSVTTEEATESVSTVSLSTESESGSTEPATEKSTEPSSTTEESTVAATTSNTIISSETAETAVSRSATTEETTESLSTISLSTETESESTKPSTEKITETEATVKSTESSSTIEMSTTTPVEETSEFITTESVSTSSYESTTEFTMSTTEVSVEETSTLSTSSEKTSETSLSTETIETSTTEETTLSSETTSDTTVQEASTKTTITTEVPAASIGTTVRDWKTTIFTAKPICRRRKLQCSKSKFGCCPDKKTAAAGPFDEGCPKPKTCKESQFKCCPDEISPALGPKYEGCPIMPCAETLFGCCASDNKTAAEGNDQEGCPPKSAACKSSAYGCCMDGKTEATDLDRSECPEYSTTQTESSTETEGSTETGAETETEAGTETTSQNETTFTETASTAPEGCTGSAFGCCFDNETEASGANGQGCPCNSTKFGCCPDGVSPANGTQMEGCAASCNTSTFGCCPDGKTPAHGPGHEGCCLLYPFGCCPDNYKPADGPHLEGCGCQYARFGCCPDNVTSARGSNNEGCGCQYSAHGCCPDRHTEASGPGFEGCGCHTYQFGCCPDGVTIVKGPGLQGCLCYQSKYGCCGDGETAASGPDMQGCDCSSSKYGCCPDGITEAKGSKFSGCTDIPLNRQAACSLSTDRGSCRNYSVHWYYDLEYGGCSRFWYGGCEGNGNRFTSKEECEDVCVQPSPQDTCKLPKVKGACTGYNVRWYYDSEREQCSQFVFGGCLGNANNFDSRELCQSQCEPTRTADQCSLPIDRGSCSGNFGRWGFNAETRRCEQFIWGGCEGNSNRFGSEAACVQRCDPPGAPKPRCTQPQDVGNCTDKEALWSFSQSENRCVPFYYTGCGGNENRFDTEHSCTDACPSSYTPDVCTLPAETGDCANYRERWYFDTSKQRCRQFYYGGCGGNSNNFASQTECENRCSDFTVTTTVKPPELRTDQTVTENISPSCLLEKDPGPCTQMSTRWAYDYTIGKCTQFQYGGCGGNINNFPNEENCEYYCKPVQDICQLPMLSGPCEDSLMKWFYDASTDACNQFTYGGCEGNDNRFDSREDCERRCRTGPPPETTSTTTTSTTAAPPVIVQNRFKEDLPQACIVSLEPEECTRAGIVWHYETEVSDCVAYENKEAGKVCRNTGVFASEEACQRSCGAFKNINVCRYPSDPGPCQGFVPKYYFNQTSGNCHEFAYGGCLGSPNRFSSFDECLQVCRPEMDPCKLGPEPGNCLERFVMWYYDYYRDSCSQFTYTGCGGNDNRFESREDCEGRCRQRPAVVTTTGAAIEVADTTTTTTIVVPTVQPVAEECRTPDSLAPCGANITVFYYDSVRKVCVESDIGGCDHLENIHRTEEECERKCGVFKDINVCEARLDAGPCHASIPKFYWDFASGRCQPYTYGGCKGGANRFSFIEECEEVCGSTGPGSNEVVPACSLYISECSRLNCAYGIEQRRDSEGCVRCSCKAPELNCEPMRRECETLRCPYGVQRLTDENGCDRCVCFEDPCLRNNCTVGEQCVAIAYRDPVTQEPHYSAQCRLITPEPPNCDRFDDECSRLQCGELGIQRVRTVEGCERCSCVPLQIDCEPLRRECDELKCTYSVERTTGPDGCERCRCTQHPCDNKECPEGDRCIAVPYRDPITQDTRYTAECRTVKKAGYCPVSVETVVARPCRRDCNDDADCRGVAKCCPRGCSYQCQEPDEPTVPTTVPLPYTTTHKPDIPEPPRASHETEPEVSGTEGGKATLRCLFHGNPPPKITWSRNEITIDADEGRYRLLSDGALEIVSLYRNDSGVYICIANNGLGSARQEVHLQVKDPVTSAMSIAGEPNAVLTGELGRPLVIRCLVYGYPPPTVYWLRGLNGPMVPFSSSLYEARLPGVLLIRRLTADTVGEYLCQAYNGVGRPATKLFVVRAYQSDEYPIISKYIIPRERDESEAVTLKSIDVTTQRITTHTEDMTTTTSTTTVTTPEPDIDFEKPVFHVAVRTHISAPQTTLNAGSELSLPCEVDGYPDPEVYWTKDNVRLVARDNLWISGTSISRLTIPRLSVSDSGVYGCHAGNAYSSHYSTVQINVQGLTIPSKCTDNPFFANCHLIVRSKFCQHKYYSVFCCKSCMEAGQLSPADVDVQGDQAWTKAK